LACWFHLPSVRSGRNAGDVGALVRRRKGDQLGNAARTMALLISPRDKATHAMGNEDDAVLACFGRQRFDPPVQLFGKIVNIPERRLEVERRDHQIQGSQFAP
jgi:hypothetical protein